MNDDEIRDVLFNDRPLKRTAMERFKKHTESASGNYEDQKDIFRQCRDVQMPAFWLSGTSAEGLVWELIGALRRCYDNDMGNFLALQQRIIDVRGVLFEVGLKVPEKRPDYGMDFSSPTSQYYSEALKIKPVYRPLQANQIAENHIEPYGRLLHIEQLWASDFFLFDIPAAYVGAGKIAVRYFIATLGRIVQMFRDPATKPSHLEDEFATLEDARSIISKIAKEEF